MKQTLKAKSMYELIKKVYANEGWTHVLGQNKTKRVMTQYLVEATDDWYVAKRKGSYYTLLTNETEPGEKDDWAPQFGDWDKKVVQEEMKDTYKHVRHNRKKIVETDGSPEALSMIIAQLNG